MLRRITLDNFMSHAHTVIELADGLTVLVGPNNCGKSAVVEALRTVCGENAGDFMVRHGQRTASVTIETGDGHSITWRRKGPAVSYVIDGREISRSGRGNLPEDLHERLRLPRVEPAQSSKSFDVHFGQQKSPIFLIDSASDPAAFFSTSSDAERLLEIQKLHKQKVAGAKTDHRNGTTELASLDEQLATLLPLDELGSAMGALESEHTELIEQIKQEAELERFIQEIESHQARHERLKAGAVAVALLESPPALADIEPLDATIQCLHTAGGNCDHYREVGGALGPLTAPPALLDLSPLETLGRQILQCARAEARWQAVARGLGELAEAPVPREVGPLRDSIEAIERAMRLADRARLRHAVTAGLIDPPAIADLAPLQEWINRAAALEKGVLQHRAAGKSLEIELAGLERDLAAWIDANPTCPVCGSPTQRATILAGGHTHA